MEKLVYDHVIKDCIVMILLKRLELRTALILVLPIFEALDFECQCTFRVDFLNVIL